MKHPNAQWSTADDALHYLDNVLLSSIRGQAGDEHLHTLHPYLHHPQSPALVGTVALICFLH